MYAWLLTLLLAASAHEQPGTPGDQKRLEEIVRELNRRAAIASLTRIGISGSLPADPQWSDEKTSFLMQQLQPVANDDRHEIYEAPPTPPRLVQNIAATAAIIPEAKLEPASGAGINWTLQAKNAHATYQLCNGEKFEDQMVPAVCTAFLVDSQIVATAGHCIQHPSDLHDHLFVFGFECIAAGNCHDVFNVCDVYHGISMAQKRAGNIDWALIKLDRKVTGPNRVPVVRRASGSISTGTDVYMIGHPAGGPAKYIDNGKVLALMADSFTTDLDGFEANSGSPVFNASTHELEGVFITAGAGFVPSNNPTCNITLTCGSACPGVAMSVTALPATSIVGSSFVCP